MNLSVLLNPLVSRCCAAQASRLFPKYAVIFLLLLCSAAHCNAQFDSAEVLGAIKDPSGAVVPGATVVLTNPAKGIKVTRSEERRVGKEC